MLAEQELDLVVIATPDHLHRAPFLAAVDAGVPSVLLEKPGGGTVMRALQSGQPDLDHWRVVSAVIDAIKEGSRTPASWRAFGTVPSGDDGLRQARVSCPIEESAATGMPVDL